MSELNTTQKEHSSSITTGASSLSNLHGMPFVGLSLRNFSAFSPSSQGADSSCMMLREALQRFERKGLVEYTVGGHRCQRPASVQQGKQDDCFEVSPDESKVLLWRPNNVPTKSLKAANVASSFSWPSLEASPLTLAPWCVQRYFRG